MSSETLLQNFFIYAPDKTEPGTLEKRMSVRSKHLEVAKENIEAKLIRIGGGLLTPESILPGADKKMVGSMFIVSAPDLQTVKNMVESDIYYTSGVWDTEKLVILPWMGATPL